MVGAPEWPAYTLGSHDSIFALGVASCKFAELEGAMHFIFSTIFDFGLDTGQMVAAKIGNEAALDLMQRELPRAEILKQPRIPASASADVEYFIKGVALCLKNRNHLMHSNFAWHTQPVLFKTTKQGLTQIAVPTLAELRQIADDIHAYCGYGRQLGNAINNKKFTPPIFPDAAFPWPDKPALPRELQYSSEPQALRTPQGNQPPPGSSQA
jgi:hypothetical protein